MRGSPFLLCSSVNSRTELRSEGRFSSLMSAKRQKETS